MKSSGLLGFQPKFLGGIIEEIDLDLKCKREVLNLVNVKVCNRYLYELLK